MLEGSRARFGLDKLKKTLRQKLVNLVDDATGRHNREQLEQIQQLRDQVATLQAELHHQGNRVVDRVGDLEYRTRRDITFAGDQYSAREASDFTREHMVGARHFEHPHETLRYGLSLAPTGEMALEFGVFTGTTLKIISAERTEGQVFGFDSFEGLPTDWRSGFPAGTFRVDGLPDVPGAELVVGLFEDTLPGFLDSHPGPVDFLHIDGDLYSSAKVVLDQVGPRLRVGSVVVFDEFFNFPGWQRHEYRAWCEYVERTGIEFTYCGYTWNNEQVVIQITAV